MTKVHSQPIMDEPTPDEFQAWADEAQACIDSGEVIISDHRKARATVDALRSHAALVKALEFYRDGWQPKTHKNRPGLEWYATPVLLDDCGETARAALSHRSAKT